MNLTYRVELDGLRAIALLSVVIFHFHPTVCPGGYIGVDIFFVLSGYLISSIIYKSTQEHSFRIRTFINRRVRRLIPALVCVITLSIPFASLWMLPDELKSFGQSVVATTLAANNILLVLTSGYWALASEFKPLLNTWSLGVEIQFYTVFPPIFFFALRQKKYAPHLILVLLAVGSLIWAQFALTYAPKSAFYLLPSRAWEFLCGAIIPLTAIENYSRTQCRFFGETVAIVGASGILVSVLTFDQTTAHPGLITLLPVISTVLLIAAPLDNTTVGKILKLKWLTYIGLSSYSIYLWHFPILAFARIRAASEASMPSVNTLLAASIIAGIASYLLIEKNFRNETFISNRKFYKILTPTLAGLILTGAILHLKQGFPGRLSSQPINFSDATIAFNERAYAHRSLNFPKNGRINLLVIGNSYARDFVNLFFQRYDRGSVNLVYRDDVNYDLSTEATGIHASLLHDASIIVLASDQVLLPFIKENKLYAHQKNKKVYYLGTKHFGWNLNWIVQVPLTQRENLSNDLIDSVISAENAMKNSTSPEEYISILERICDNGRIPVTDSDGNLLSQDRKHLTNWGVKYIAERVFEGTAFEENLLENGVKIVNRVITGKP